MKNSLCFIIKVSPNCITNKILTMIYRYIRVSSDKQTVENQRFEITHLQQKRDGKFHPTPLENV